MKTWTFMNKTSCFKVEIIWETKTEYYINVDKKYVSDIQKTTLLDNILAYIIIWVWLFLLWSLSKWIYILLTK